jgi:O-antigen ligase
MQAVYFALYISLCILCILDILRGRYLALGKIKVMTFVVLLVFYLVIIVATGARTAIASLLIILVIVFVVYAIKFKMYKFIMAAVFVPIIFVALVLFNPVVSSRFEDLKYGKTEGTSYDSYFARINIWKPSIDLIGDNLWSGVGTGDQEYELMKKFSEHNYVAGIEFKFNTHNLYMQTMLGHGFLGLLCLLAILALQFFVAYNRGDLLYLSFVLLFSLAGLTESLLNRNKGVIIFLLFSFLLYETSTQSQASEPKKKL